jgi:hypothetical protein
LIQRDHLHNHTEEEVEVSTIMVASDLVMKKTATILVGDIKKEEEADTITIIEMKYILSKLFHF